MSTGDLLLWQVGGVGGEGKWAKNNSDNNLKLVVKKKIVSGRRKLTRASKTNPIKQSADVQEYKQAQKV